MRLAFDVGMYDGADTGYLLEAGFRVVAVEAHPGLCERARRRFADAVRDERLVIVNRAIADRAGERELVLCGDDLGSSSIMHGKLQDGRREGGLPVTSIALAALFEEHGVPDYLKIDIEGADRHCVLPLTPRTAPKYLSFEVDEDVEELVSHAARIGYDRFKLIGQTSFLEIDHEHALLQRLRNRALRSLGYDEPGCVRRNGRWFALMHSSGPGPWHSDGRWYSAARLLEKWRRSGERGTRQGWYDVHAMH